VRLLVVVACVYTSNAIPLFACLKNSCPVFTSSPFAFSSVPKECRNVSEGNLIQSGQGRYEQKQSEHRGNAMYHFRITAP
jgi:hypothetical protein